VLGIDLDVVTERVEAAFDPARSPARHGAADDGAAIAATAARQAGTFRSPAGEEMPGTVAAGVVAWHDGYIGVEHLALALISMTDGMVPCIFARLGISTARPVLQFLDATAGPADRLCRRRSRLECTLGGHHGSVQARTTPPPSRSIAPYPRMPAGPLRNFRCFPTACNRWDVVDCDLTLENGEKPPLIPTRHPELLTPAPDRGSRKIAINSQIPTARWPS